MPPDEDESPPASTPKPKTVPPPALGPNPTLGEIVTYIRALGLYTEAIAWANRTHSNELKGIRETVQAHGVRIESCCVRMEKAAERMEMASQPRDTLPPQSGH